MGKQRRRSDGRLGTTIVAAMIAAVAIAMVHLAMLHSVASQPPATDVSTLAASDWIFAVELACGLAVVAIANASGRRRRRGASAGRVRALGPTLFRERLSEEVARSRREGVPLAVLALEVGSDRVTWRDRDEVERAVCRACRLSDLVGDDGAAGPIAIVAPDTDASGALALAVRIRRSVVASYATNRHSRPPGPVSVGVTYTAADRASSPEALVAAANSALEQARRRGGDYAVLAPRVA